MSDPINPPPVRRWQPHFLPAYLSNGVIGLRVPRIPLVDGVAIVSGFAGVHPVDGVESFAQAPYPVAAELTIDDVTLSGHPSAPFSTSRRTTSRAANCAHDSTSTAAPPARTSRC